VALAACAAPNMPVPPQPPMLVSHEVAAALDDYRAAVGSTGRGAFAVSTNGAEFAHIVCADGNCGAILPKTQALLDCEVKAKDDCRLVAADRDQLIAFDLRPLGWKPEPPMPPPPPLSGNEIKDYLMNQFLVGKIAGYGSFTIAIHRNGGFDGSGRQGDISGRWSISVDRFCVDSLNGQELGLCAHVAIKDHQVWLIGDDDRLRRFYHVVVTSILGGLTQ
jgi:hypothetical protein